mgnify:CR=1 FL=1
MPASMMSAESGSMPKVIGRSSAMPAEGPIPGSMPMIVPMSAPRNTNIRFFGCIAIAKPSSVPANTLSRSSVSGMPGQSSRGSLHRNPPHG